MKPPCRHNECHFWFMTKFLRLCHVHFSKVSVNRSLSHPLKHSNHRCESVTNQFGQSTNQEPSVYVKFLCARCNKVTKSIWLEDFWGHKMCTVLLWDQSYASIVFIFPLHTYWIQEDHSHPQGNCDMHVCGTVLLFYKPIHCTWGV